MSSYKVEVIADNTGTWCGNGMRYASRADAENAAHNLACRWLAVRAWRIQCDDNAAPNTPLVNADPPPEQE